MSYVRRPKTTKQPLRSPARLLAGIALSVAALVTLSACENDSYMNPSVVGRWEETPTIVPILDRLAAVEGTAAENGDYSPITQADLIPEVEAYRIDSGDGIQILVNELFNPNQNEAYERLVDNRGFIDLPNVPSVYIAGMTADEASTAVAAAYKARRVLNEPVVWVYGPSRRRQTFNLIGGVTSPGTYSIPRPEFRLLEAISQGGRFSEYVTSVYVIRGVPLSDRAAGRYKPASAEMIGTPAGAPPAKLIDVPNAPAPAPGGAKKESVIDLIDSLGGPEKNPKPAPGMMQPTGDNRVPVPVIDIDSVAKPEAKPAPAQAPGQTKPATNQPAGGGLGETSPLTQPAKPNTAQSGTRWVFVDGQWVASGSPRGMQPSSGSRTGGNANPAADVLMQRVIQIPMAALLGGSAMHNIVIRPGDIIRVPSPTEGLVYVEGQVQRPGPYSLPTVGRLTLTRAIVSAGGLGDTAIPERLDITRFVGQDRQATVRLNLRAIKEGTQPDLYLREGDMINVGTNFWALPLAVIRNGFRASYGFGFILDRNFGYEIFGPQNTGSNFN